MRAIAYVIAAGLVFGLSSCAKKEESTKEMQTEPAQQAAAVTEQSDVRKDALSKPAAPPAAGTVTGLSDEDRSRLEQTVASSFGKGSFKNDAGDSYTFTLEGSMLKDNSSHGQFRFYSFQEDGKMDLKGTMTCVHIDSGERKIWLSGQITENSSTDQKYREGQYAIGQYLQFRARPNSMDGKNPAAIEVPSFVSEAEAIAFCGDKSWSDDGLYELGPNDLIAAIP